MKHRIKTYHGLVEVVDVGLVVEVVVELHGRRTMRTARTARPSAHACVNRGRARERETGAPKQGLR